MGKRRELLTRGYIKRAKMLGYLMLVALVIMLLYYLGIIH